MLKRLIRFISNNPLVAGTIAGTIAAVVGGLILAWALDRHLMVDLRQLMLAVWTALTDTGTYLTGTVPVHRWALLVLLVGLLAFAVVLANVSVWWNLREPEGRPAVDLSLVSRPLSEVQLGALSVLLEHYPHGLQLNFIHEQIQSRGADCQHRAQVARELETLAPSGLVHIETNSIDAAIKSYFITEPGRDLMLDWITAARAQS
jgi:hypothetical protein